MAVDYTTARGRVRLQIPDTSDTPLFTDDQIDAFLSLATDNVDRATARALRTIASNMTMILKYVKDHDITVDGTVVGKELRAMAKDLDEAASAADALSASGFMLVSVPYDFSEDSWDSNA